MKSQLDANKLEDMSKPMKTIPIWILERDLRYFYPKEQNQLLEKKKSLKDVFTACDCKGRENGPWYTYLGYTHRNSGSKLKRGLGNGQSGDSIRFIPVQFEGYEGKSVKQCSVSRWVICRSSQPEKYVCCRLSNQKTLTKWKV